MTTPRLLPVLAAVGLLLPVAARAAEPPEQEFRAVARCSVATSVYQVIVDGGWDGATPTDKSLAVRATAADKVLGKRGGTLILSIGKEKAEAIFDEETAAAKAKMDASGGDKAAVARAALDFYGPTLEGCVARAGTLIG